MQSTPSTVTRQAPIDLSRLIEALPSPALMVDGQRRVVAANREYRTRLPQSSEVVGLPCYTVSHGRSACCRMPGRTCPLDEVSRTGRPSRVVHVHGGIPAGRFEEILALPVGPTEARSRLVLQLIHPLGRSRPMPPGRLLGRSPAIRQLLRDIDRVKDWRRPILVRGEAGTERELVARALHRAGPWSDGPFVSFACAGLDAVSCEQVLFAGGLLPQEPQSLFEAAAGGILFLDEVEALSLPRQEALLEKVEAYAADRPERRRPRLILGSAEPHFAPRSRRSPLSRLIPAIERSQLTVPPVRDRRGDLPLLVAAMRAWLVAPPELEIGSDVAAALATRRLRGNLWELRSLLQQAVLAAGAGPVAAEHLP